MWFSLQWLFPTSFSKHPVLVLFFCVRVYVSTLCVIVRLVRQHEHNSKIWEYSIISRQAVIFIYVIYFLSLFSSFPCSVHGNQFQLLGCWKKKNLFLLPKECKLNLSCSSETAEVIFLKKKCITGTVCEHSVCPGEAFQSFLTELQF